MNITFKCKSIAEIKPNSDYSRLLTVTLEGADYESIISQIIEEKGIDAILNQLTEKQIHEHLKFRL